MEPNLLVYSTTRIMKLMLKIFNLTRTDVRLAYALSVCLSLSLLKTAQRRTLQPFWQCFYTCKSEMENNFHSSIRWNFCERITTHKQIKYNRLKTKKRTGHRFSFHVLLLYRINNFGKVASPLIILLDYNFHHRIWLNRFQRFLFLFWFYTKEKFIANLGSEIVIFLIFSDLIMDFISNRKKPLSNSGLFQFRW